jgi:hypothetical protein
MACMGSFKTCHGLKWRGVPRTEQHSTHSRSVPRTEQHSNGNFMLAEYGHTNTTNKTKGINKTNKTVWKLSKELLCTPTKLNEKKSHLTKTRTRKDTILIYHFELKRNKKITSLFQSVVLSCKRLPDSKKKKTKVKQNKNKIKPKINKTSTTTCKYLTFLQLSISWWWNKFPFLHYSERKQQRRR